MGRLVFLSFQNGTVAKVLTTLLNPTKTSQEGRLLGPAMISLLLALPGE
jgi:hypothetical protein